MTAAPRTFLEELDVLKRTMKRFNIRWHLARFPKDLLADWWRVDGDLPFYTSVAAYAAYKTGTKPGPLFKGPPWKPQLRLIEGGLKISPTIEVYQNDDEFNPAATAGE